jgi:hypothetical protein
LTALAVLTGATPLLAAVRHSDLGLLTEPEGWFTGVLAALFMGSWGWISLAFSKASDGHRASWWLTILAIVYFVVALALFADIALRGNSTSAIAIFLFPIYGAVVMIPSIAIVAYAGRAAGNSGQ